LEPPAELLVRRNGQSETQQRFWEALRFAVFSATVCLMPLSKDAPDQIEEDLEF
jgi:hypothetical protein